MTDQWRFWLRALAGEAPQSLVRGIPEAGFFLLRERKTTRTPEADRTVGGPRHKVTTLHHPVAIWEDEFGWHCVITRPDQTTYLTDPAEIDERVFSPCSRAPISHEKYLELTKQSEEVS
jgi:hypothetical protein